jgi:hypothetical protein
MEKYILSEINRVREIMGLELITEAPAPVPTPLFLKKFLESIVEPLLRTADGQTTLKKVLRSTNSDIDISTINQIIQSIRNMDFDNPILKNVDIAKLYKQILRDLPTNDAIEQVRQSVRQIFKTEFPEFDQLASRVGDVINVLTPYNAKKNPKAFNELLEKFTNLKNQIENSNISQEFKNLIIDSYKLNRLPKSAKEAIHIDENKSLIKNLFKGLYTTAQELTNTRVPNAPKKFKIKDVELSGDEYRLLGEYSEGVIGINNLPKSLQSKMITLITSDDKLVEEYFKNFLKTLGKDENELIKDTFMKAKNEGVNWREVLDREMSDFDFEILENRIKNLFANMEGIYKLAFEESDAVYGKWRTKIRNVLQSITPQTLNSIDYTLNWFKTMAITFTQGEETAIKEMEKVLNDEMSKMAQESIDGIPIAGRLDKIKNIYSLLNSSIYSTQKAKQWFDKNLAKEGIFQGDVNYNKFVNSKEYEQLVEALSQGLQESWGATIRAMLTPYMRLIGGDAWIDFLQELFNKEFSKAGKSFVNIFGNIVGGVINTILYAKPHTAAQLRVLDTLAGKYGKPVDKLIQIYFFTYLAVPYFRGFFERYAINEKLISYRENFQKYKTTFCSPGKILDEKFCQQLDDNIAKLEETPSWADISAELRSDTKLTSPWTLIPEFKEFWDDYSTEVTSGRGTEAFVTNFVSKWQLKVDEEFKNLNTQLKDTYGIDTSLPPEQQQTQLFDAIKREREKANQEEQNNKIDKTPKGFQNWAAKNEYTVITDFDADGIGIAYKNDDTSETPVEFQWKDNTFKSD